MTSCRSLSAVYATLIWVESSTYVAAVALLAAALDCTGLPAAGLDTSGLETVGLVTAGLLTGMTADRAFTVTRGFAHPPTIARLAINSPAIARVRHRSMPLGCASALRGSIERRRRLQRAPTRCSCRELRRTPTNSDELRRTPLPNYADQRSLSTRPGLGTGTELHRVGLVPAAQFR